MKLGMIVLMLVGLMSSSLTLADDAPKDKDKGKHAKSVKSGREKLVKSDETKFYQDLIKKLDEMDGGSGEVKFGAKKLADFKFTEKGKEEETKGAAGLKSLIDRILDYRAGIQEFCWDEAKHKHSRALAKRVDAAVKILWNKVKDYADVSKALAITFDADETKALNQVQLLVAEYFDGGSPATPKNSAKKIADAKGYKDEHKRKQLGDDDALVKNISMFGQLDVTATPPSDADNQATIRLLNNSSTEACIFVDKPAEREEPKAKDDEKDEDEGDGTGPSSSSATETKPKDTPPAGTGGIPAQPGSTTPTTPGGTPPGSTPPTTPGEPTAAVPPPGGPGDIGLPPLDGLFPQDNLASLLPLLAQNDDDDDDDQQQAIPPPPPGKAAAAPGASPSSSSPPTGGGQQSGGGQPPPGGDEGQGQQPPPGGFPPPPGMGGMDPFSLGGSNQDSGNSDLAALLAAFGNRNQVGEKDRALAPLPGWLGNNAFARLGTMWQPGFGFGPTNGWPQAGVPGWGMQQQPVGNYGTSLQQRYGAAAVGGAAVGRTSGVPTGTGSVVMGQTQSGSTSASPVPGARVPFDPSNRGMRNM